MSLERMSDSKVECLVSSPCIGRIADLEARSVIVADAGVGNIKIGALGQTVEVPYGPLAGIAGDIAGSAFGNRILNDDQFNPTQFVSSVAGSLASSATAAMANRYGHACFVAGAVIHTRNGPLAVEKFVGGEQVLARDEKTHEIAYRGVLGTKLTPDQAIWRVVVGNGQGTEKVLRTTAEHPFWIKSKGWKKAALLMAGDQSAGRCVPVCRFRSQFAEPAARQS